MKNYFIYRETVSTEGYMIVPNYELLGANYVIGSYQVLAARFMGLTWPNWLRLCRNNGAVLHGKNHLYPTPIWSKPNDIFLQQLNERVDKIAKIINIKELKY